MAQKRRKKRSRFRRLLFYVFFPLLIWLVAFLIWFYWNNVTGLFSGAADKSKSAVKAGRRPERSEKDETPAARRPQERILDEDRKSLEDVLKRRQ